MILSWYFVILELDILWVFVFYRNSTACHCSPLCLFPENPSDILPVVPDHQSTTNTDHITYILLYNTNLYTYRAENRQHVKNITFKKLSKLNMQTQLQVGHFRLFSPTKCKHGTLVLSKHALDQHSNIGSTNP